MAADDVPPVRLEGDFGPNVGLVEEIYRQWLEDPGSVAESWRDFFADYTPRLPAERGGNGEAVAAPPPPPAPAPTPAPAPAPTERAPEPRPGVGQGPHAPEEDGARGMGGVPPTTAAGAATGSAPSGAPKAPETKADVKPVPLRGAGALIVRNMEASLGVPTATSARVIPARLLEVNRRVVNNYLTRMQRGGKVSFTHLIGWAVVRALGRMPVMNSSYATVDGKPGVIRHEHVNLGLAVDVAKADGSHSLLVPNIIEADTLDFDAFFAAYEDVIRRVRIGKIGADDFAGTTLTLTNPGTIGTVHSVPRLMPGQGAIIGVGTIDYPAEYQGADPRTIARLGIGNVVTVSLRQAIVPNELRGRVGNAFKMIICSIVPAAAVADNWIDADDPRGVHSFRDARGAIDKRKHEGRQERVEPRISGERAVQRRVVEKSGIKRRTDRGQLGTANRIGIDAAPIGARAKRAGKCQRYQQPTHVVENMGLLRAARNYHAVLIRAE